MTVDESFIEEHRNLVESSTRKRRNQTAVSPNADLTNVALVDFETVLLRDYPVGGILRIKLTNFVTYESCEFRPGPHLNMIIGPNGTGKSSIVCAIALGLAGGTNLLGRAKDVADFVRHGAEKASIEIELKQDAQGTHVLIQRDFTRVNNSSEWHINGRQTPLREVHDLMKRLNIQVDNLCQFLPQDKVAEFAQLSPKELLRETETAVGGKELLEQHETLIRLNESRRKLAEEIMDLRHTIDALKKRNQALEHVVQRIHEQQQFENKIVRLKRHLPSLHYREARAQVENKKQMTEETLTHLNELRHRYEPQEHQFQQRNEQRIQIEQEGQSFRQEIVHHEGDLARLSEDLTRIDQQSSQFTTEYQNALKRNQEKRRRLELARREVEEAQEILEAKQHEGIDAPPWEPGGQPRIYRDATERCEHELQHLQSTLARETVRLQPAATRIAQIQQEQGSIHNEARQLRERLVRVQQEVKELEDLRNQRIQILRERNNDIWKAMEWLRVPQNLTLFHGAVYEPLCLNLNVRDSRYAAEVENQIPERFMCAFVCQTREDLETFLREMRDRQQLQIQVTTVPDLRLSDYQTSISREEILRLGFDGYLLEWIDAPEDILRVLCEQAYIHIIPVSKQQVDAELVSQNHAIRSFMAAGWRYTFNTSRYGRNERSMRASVLKSCRMLNVSVDKDEKDRLEREIVQLHGRQVENEQRMKHLAVEEQHLQRELNALSELKQHMVQERRKWTQIQNAISACQVHVDTKQMQWKRLQSEVDKEETLVHESERIRRLLDLKLEEKREHVQQFAVCLQAWKRSITHHTLVGLRNRELAESIYTMQMELRNLQEELAQAERTFTHAKDELEHAQQEAQQAQTNARRIGPLNEEERTALAQDLLDYLCRMQNPSRQGDENSSREIRPPQKKTLSDDSLEETPSEAEESTSELNDQGSFLSSKEFTMDQIEQKLQDIEQVSYLLTILQARLDASLSAHSRDMSVLNEFEQRQQEMSSLQEQLANKELELQQLVEEIAPQKQSWIKLIHFFISQINHHFSSSFQHIGCVGEVRFSPRLGEDGEDHFAEYALEILVKFRDTERLQLLTAQRQSGGERSVTTILFMMALQQLSKAPFRVVDEINQGMDPQNERRIHREIMEAACCQNTSQYFLITPKLLADLDYHERMKILCIYNGEWQPARQTWNMRFFLDAHQRQKQKGSS